ncbi:expressed unknown protein [Seminavis robusta]|uniref:Uncharacterized protein n=1 Tax=Seminavis robusta TaxID=568900 RepID=A0A9N8DT95_9STRA|nr:expressed unknown protein [Seminavis robusta]|eukprot:Sro339_g121120.1 n/a (218) ;mRNA; f:65514-66167
MAAWDEANYYANYDDDGDWIGFPPVAPWNDYGDDEDDDDSESDEIDIQVSRDEEEEEDVHPNRIVIHCKRVDKDDDSEEEEEEEEEEVSYHQLQLGALRRKLFVIPQETDTALVSSSEIASRHKEKKRLRKEDLIQTMGPHLIRDLETEFYLAAQVKDDCNDDDDDDLAVVHVVVPVMKKTTTTKVVKATKKAKTTTKVKPTRGGRRRQPRRVSVGK